MNTAKDLSKEPPRSPRVRLGGYALMARMSDKGRADINGTVGEYHFACPLDSRLFEFKGVNADEVRKVLASGASDEELLSWFNSHGTPKMRRKSRHGRLLSKLGRRTKNPKEKSGLLKSANAWGSIPQRRLWRSFWRPMIA